MTNEELKQRLIELVKASLFRHIDKSCLLTENIVNDLIANGVTIREWIPVTERLPEKCQEALAYRGDFRGDMMNTYTYLGSGNWEDDYGYRGSAEHEGITHWMPLPEPPERSDVE